MTSSRTSSSSTTGSGRGSALYHYLITLLVGIVVGQFLSGSLWQFTDDDAASRSTKAAATDASTEPKLADGCFHVFLDVGANIGVHGRFLFEPHKFPEAKVALRFFQQQLGPPAVRDNRDVCVFAFEPNPKHYNRLRTVRDAYKAIGWQYHVIEAGVSDESSEIQFYPRNDKDYSERGFSAIRVAEGMGGLAASGPITVPVIGLAAWIRQHVQGRRLPDVVYGNYTTTAADNPSNNSTTTTTPQPKVLMKMDIEGMEYRVLPDLLVSGVFCNVITAIFGEVHNHFFPQKLASGDILTKEVGLPYWQHLNRAWQVNPDCRGKWIPGDDEHYLNDGIPLPEAPNATTAQA